MVLMREYRICMPLTVQEYQVGQLYMIARHSLEQSGDGEGVEVVENTEIEDPKHGKGQFTEKRIHLSSRLPYWVQAIVPRIFYVTEKAWNYYPYTITEYSCLGFTPEQLAERTVDHIDIAYDDLSAKHYKEEEDPRFFQSKMTQRGPLVEGWRAHYTPIMCSYKLVNASFEVFGLQTKVEEFIQSCIREVLLLGHRQAFAWIDEWIEMSLSDVRQYELDLQKQANCLITRKNEDVATAVSTPTRPNNIVAMTGEETAENGGNATSRSPSPRSPKSPTKRGYFSWF